MKYIYLFVSFLCLSMPGFAQNSADPDFSQVKDYNKKMDSLKQYCNILLGCDSTKGDNFPKALVYGLKGLQMAHKDDHKHLSHFALVAGVGYYTVARFDSALHYIKLAATEGRNAGDVWLTAWSQSSLIPIYMQSQQLSLADSVAETLKAISDTTKNAQALAKCYYGLGNYYYLKSYYATAQNYFLKSRDITKLISDTSKDNRYRMEYAVQSYMLYKVYSNSELYDKALSALKEGSRYMHTSSTLVLRYHSAYIDVYTTSPVADIDSALYYYHSLVEIPRSTKGVNSEFVLSNIGIAQYYIKKQDYQSALPYITKAETLAEESKSPFLMHQVQHIKGIYSFRTGNYDEAIDLLSKAAAISKDVNKGNYLESIHLIAQAYKAKGNLQKAIEYYDLYDQEKDAYTKANMNRYFADLNVQYQTREKEKQIGLLSSINQVRELELRNASRLRIFLVAGLVALGIISLLLYLIYRNKEKSNKALNDRNRELDKLNARLALANESKAKLFGIFSHDLRSPVSKIAQFLRLQKDNPDLFNDNARSEYHEKFTHATANLLNTMEDLLLWSKSQMENFTPEYHAVAIKDIAQKEAAMLHSQVEEKELSIANNIPESFLSLTDENFVSIILRNLLQNAVRYSQTSGSIQIEAQESAVLITNKSTSGMDAAALNALLQKGEVSSNNFGLGLQIAQDLAERIGIRLSFVEQQPGYVTAVMAWQPD